MDICGSCPPRDTIFRMCTGIEDLYLGLLGVVCSDTFPDLNQFPQLRRLSLRGYTRSFAHEVCSQNSPSLRSLTHLHWGWEYKERGQGFPPIKQMIQNLPTLSHFSIQWDHRKSFWDGISELANLDQLKVIGVIRLLGIMSVVLDAERVPVEWMSVLGERKVILMGLGADDEMDEGEERIWWDPIEHYAEYWAIMPAETPAEAQKKPDWLEQFTAYS
ncbi:hypothetical protein DL96DRAFT_1679427 [Flagelloscypha sp. PMI_526]|nr:hypothetical protein DL96DRAFT_1679427 [Flagelloscypha sp. PMI_526]